MAAQMLFNVLTNFRFEVGSALLGSQMLRDQVQGISDAADNAQQSLLNVGVGLGTSLGILPSSVIGLFGMAIQSSDYFYESQLQWSNIISANMDNLSGDLTSFADRMKTSRTILKDIADVAQKFSLPQKELASFTKMLAPFLTAKGLEGKNFEVSLDISRSLLKGAPTLGLDLGTIQGQMLRMIEGQASQGDTLFRRLLSDAPEAFSDIKGGGKGGMAKGFNLLPSAKRVDILRAALNKFSSDVDVNTGRVNTINAQIRLLGDNIKGLSGILRPIGDAFRIPIINMLKNLNVIITTHGKEIAKNFGELLRPALEDPRKLLVNILQMKRLAGDVQKSALTAGGIAIFMGIKEGLKLLGGVIGKISTPIFGSVMILRIFNDAMIKMGFTAKLTGGILKGLAISLGIFTFSLIRFGFTMTALAFVGKAFMFAVSRIFFPMLLLTGIFQVFSRAAAKADIGDLENLPKLLADASGLLGRVKVAFMEIISPITLVIETLSDFMAPLFSKTLLLQAAVGPLGQLVTFIEALGKVSILAQASFRGLIFGALTMAQKIGEVATIIPRTIWAGLTDGMAGVKSVLASTFTEFEGGQNPLMAFNAGVDSVLNDSMARLAALEGEGAVVNRTTNIAKVEINNKFKEQMEPDRIAFTLVDQLQKLASNPRQARGGTISPVAKPVTSGGY